MKIMDSLQNTKDIDSKDLEWMYSGAEKSVDQEEYLLGRSVDSGTVPYDPQKNHVEHECIPPSLRDLRTTGDVEQVDAARKLQEDPLFEIHRREVEARKQALQNPVKLKKQLEAVKARRKSSSSEDDLDKKLVAKLNKLKNNLTNDFHKSLKKSKKHKKIKYLSSSSDDSSSNDRVNKKKVRRSKEKKYKHKSKNDRKKCGSDHYENKKSYSTDKYKIDKRNKNFHKESTRKLRSRSKEIQSPNLIYRRGRSSSEEHTVKNKNYGLIKPDGSKIEQVIKKPAEKIIKKTENKRKWFKPERRKMTEEEMDQKRREMMSNAEWRNDIKHHAAKGESNQDKVEPDYNTGAEFLKKQLLKNANYGSVEARIKSNINNIQRSNKEMDRNFARRH